MISLQDIADQIAADPTLRVVFVAHSLESAERFIADLAPLLPVETERRSRHTLRVPGWDGRNPTVWAVPPRAVIAGARIDLLVWEYRGDRSHSIDDRENHPARLTARGQQVLFNWDLELTARKSVKESTR